MKLWHKIGTGAGALLLAGSIPVIPVSNGLISVAVFYDSAGNKVEVEIPDSQYAKMGQKDGETFNPSKAGLTYAGYSYQYPASWKTIQNCFPEIPASATSSSPAIPAHCDGVKDVNTSFDDVDSLESVIQALTPDANAAIARDTSATSALTGTSITFSYTAASTNPFLTVGVIFWNSITDLTTGVTFNGVSMTKLTTASGKVENGNATEGYLATYYLAGQSGTHNIVISSNSPGPDSSSGISAISYTGVDQSSPIGVSNFVANAANTTSLQIPLTVSVANSWVIFYEGDGNGSGEAAVAPLTIVTQPHTWTNFDDSNGTVSTGLATYQHNHNSAQDGGGAFSISPAVATSAVTPITGLIYSQIW